MESGEDLPRYAAGGTRMMTRLMSDGGPDDSKRVETVDRMREESQRQGLATCRHSEPITTVFQKPAAAAGRCSLSWNLGQDQEAENP